MPLKFIDRLFTVVVTATVTSAAWIVAYGFGWSPAAHTPPKPTLTTAAKPNASASYTRPPANPGGLILPVVGIAPEALVDTFTQARAGGLRVHDAIDIMAPAGSQVIAAAPGTVEKLFLSKDGGNTVYVRSPDRQIIHYYAHLQDYAPGLHEGQAVRQGDPIGRVGSTGNANPAAPHLHFAIMQVRPEARWWDSSTPINPYPLLVNHTGTTIRH